MEIYLDNAATTRPRPEVSEAMADVDRNSYYNAAAMYAGAVQAQRTLSESMNIIHRRLTRRGEGSLIMTSGATEGNNMVIFGKITTPRHHTVVAAGEHSSTYAPSMALRQNDYNVDYVPLTASGVIDLDALRRALRPTTTLMCFSLVNSDIGTLQPARDIVKIVKQISTKAHIHCDAVQAFCKFDFDVMDLGFDTVTISAHKINGPKGIGGLWIRRGANLRPIMYGGSGQDFRPGTDNNAGIVGFARGVESFNTAESFAHVVALQERLIAGLPSGFTLTVGSAGNNPYITNIMLPGVFGNTAMNALSAMGIYVGLGSACSSRVAKNRTLLAMGISESKSKNVLRVSFGIYNTIADVDAFNEALKEVLADLK